MTEETQKNQPQMMSTMSNLEKMAPKYCTATQVTLLNNNNVVLTMIYNETPSGESPANAVLIERVVIDLDHACKLAEILQTAIKTSKEKEKP